MDDVNSIASKFALKKFMQRNTQRKSLAETEKDESTHNHKTNSSLYSKFNFNKEKIFSNIDLKKTVNKFKISPKKLSSTIKSDSKNNSFVSLKFSKNKSILKVEANKENNEKSQLQSENFNIPIKTDLYENKISFDQSNEEKNEAITEINFNSLNILYKLLMELKVKLDPIPQANSNHPFILNWVKANLQCEFYCDEFFDCLSTLPSNSFYQLAKTSAFLQIISLKLISILKNNLEESLLTQILIDKAKENFIYYLFFILKIVKFNFIVNEDSTYSYNELISLIAVNKLWLSKENFLLLWKSNIKTLKNILLKWGKPKKSDKKEKKLSFVIRNNINNYKAFKYEKIRDSLFKNLDTENLMYSFGGGNEIDKLYSDENCGEELYGEDFFKNNNESNKVNYNISGELINIANQNNISDFNVSVKSIEVGVGQINDNSSNIIIKDTNKSFSNLSINSKIISLCVKKMQLFIQLEKVLIYLDESNEKLNIYVRPYLDEFLQRMGKFFTLILFSFEEKEVRF